MEKPFMMLSNVPYRKEASTAKKRFNQLTLGPTRPATDSPDPSLATQRKLLFDPDDSQLTDDDEQDDDKENRRAEPPDSPERVDLVDVQIKQRYSEAVTTLTEELDLQMSKLELSLTQPLTDDQKLSEPLFNTESTEDQYPTHVKLEVSLSQQDTIISMDSVLTISSSNTSAATLEGDGTDAEGIIILDDDDEEEAVPRHSIEHTADTEPDPSIEDPSLIDNSQEFSGSLLPSKSSEPNCSAPNQDQEHEALLTSSVLRRLSDFFNKIPDYAEPAAPLPGETAMDDTIPETPPDSPTADNTKYTDNEDEIVIESTDDGSVIDNSHEDVFNPPPPLPLPVPPLRTVAAKQKGTQEINIRSQVSEDNKVINISAKIKVDIVIRTQEASSSSEEEPDEPDDGEGTEEDAPESVESVKQEKGVVLVKEEKRTPLSELEESSGSDEPNDPDTTVASEDSHQLLAQRETEGNANDAKTSREIAEMDTQSNSPPREPVQAALSLCSAPSPSFRRFEDTPKGLKQRSSRKPSAIDTMLSAATSQNIAEMDTVANTEHLEVSIMEQEPEPAADSIVLDEESIAILHSIYGDNWRTPQLMRSIKRTPEGSSSANSSFQPNMTDFQKFNANVRRDLESTRTEKRATVKNLIQKTRSAALPEMPKTPLTIFKTPSLVVQSPYFSNKKTASKAPIRTPLKATPKYKKILQVVDTDTDTEDDAEAPDSDDSYRIRSSAGEESSSSSSSEDDRSRGARGEGTVRNTRKPRVQRNKASGRSSTSRKGFDFTQIASSDSELDDTIFVDKETNVVQPLIPSKTERDGKEPIEGKRKLFSDLNYHTPTSSVSSPEEDDRGVAEKTEKNDRPKVVPEKEVSFPWLHDFTPVRNKAVERLKGAAEGAHHRTTPKTPGKCGFLSSLDQKIGKAIADPEAVLFREQYRQRKEELADRLFALYDEKVFGGALKPVPVKWNKKLLTTAGRCVNMARLGKRSAEIELSEKVLTSADRLRCTLIHEMCHAAAWIVDGEKKGHAGHWRRWTEAAVRALPELPKITVRHDYNIEYKYTYQCTKCSAKTQMHSKTKKAENIRCRFCHGDIEILLNKKTKTGEVVKTPVRAASGFALYVKENYKRLKQPQLKHADVMKLLSVNFADMKVTTGQQQQQ